MLGESLEHIKDVVATKANFTDLIFNFDKKVDRKEIEDFEQKVKLSDSFTKINTQHADRTLEKN